MKKIETIFPTSEEEIKKFHTKYFQRLVSDLMGRFGLDRAEAEYIVQGFFIELWQKGWQKTGEGATLPTLIKFVRLRAIDHMRKNSKLVFVDEFTGSESKDNTTKNVSEALRVIEEALPLFDQVHLSYREEIIVIIIRRLLPLPYDRDVIYGEMTDIEREKFLPDSSDQLVRAQISRNLSDLRKKLREERQKAA